jgi:hypothetical protein
MSVAAKFIKLNMGLPFAAFPIFIYFGRRYASNLGLHTL